MSVRYQFDSISVFIERKRDYIAYSYIFFSMIPLQTKKSHCTFASKQTANTHTGMIMITFIQMNIFVNDFFF